MSSYAINCMIDLETYATSVDACVMTIGAIVFDKDGKELDTFYRRIDGESCLKLGLKKDPETLKFWALQPLDARFELETTENRVSIQQGLADFIQFWMKNNCKFPWSLGSNFDISILEHIFKLIGLQPPWNFWNVRCLRTLYALGNVTTKMLESENEMQHHALDDCRKQIRGYKLCMQKLIR